MGKFYYCGISTVRLQIKNPRKKREREFNFLLRDVLIFLFDLRIWYNNYKIEGLSDIKVII